MLRFHFILLCFVSGDISDLLLTLPQGYELFPDPYIFVDQRTINGIDQLTLAELPSGFWRLLQLKVPHVLPLPVSAVNYLGRLPMLLDETTLKQASSDVLELSLHFRSICPISDQANMSEIDAPGRESEVSELSESSGSLEPSRSNSSIEDMELDFRLEIPMQSTPDVGKCSQDVEIITDLIVWTILRNRVYLEVESSVLSFLQDASHPIDDLAEVLQSILMSATDAGVDIGDRIFIFQTLNRRLQNWEGAKNEVRRTFGSALSLVSSYSHGVSKQDRQKGEASHEFVSKLITLVYEETAFLGPLSTSFDSTEVSPDDVEGASFLSELSRKHLSFFLTLMMDSCLAYPETTIDEFTRQIPEIVDFFDFFDKELNRLESELHWIEGDESIPQQELLKNYLKVIEHLKALKMSHLFPRPPYSTTGNETEVFPFVKALKQWSSLVEKRLVRIRSGLDLGRRLLGGLDLISSASFSVLTLKSLLGERQLTLAEKRLSAEEKAIFMDPNQDSIFLPIPEEMRLLLPLFPHLTSFYRSYLHHSRQTLSGVLRTTPIRHIVSLRGHPALLHLDPFHPGEAPPNIWTRLQSYYGEHSSFLRRACCCDRRGKSKASSDTHRQESCFLQEVFRMREAHFPLRLEEMFRSLAMVDLLRPQEIHEEILGILEESSSFDAHQSLNLAFGLMKRLRLVCVTLFLEKGLQSSALLRLADTERQRIGASSASKVLELFYQEFDYFFDLYGISPEIADAEILGFSEELFISMFKNRFGLLSLPFVDHLGLFPESAEGEAVKSSAVGYQVSRMIWKFVPNLNGIPRSLSPFYLQLVSLSLISCSLALWPPREQRDWVRENWPQILEEVAKYEELRERRRLLDGQESEEQALWSRASLRAVEQLMEEDKDLAAEVFIYLIARPLKSTAFEGEEGVIWQLANLPEAYIPNDSFLVDLAKEEPFSGLSLLAQKRMKISLFFIKGAMDDGADAETAVGEDEVHVADISESWEAFT